MFSIHTGSIKLEDIFKKYSVVCGRFIEDFAHAGPKEYKGIVSDNPVSLSVGQLRLGRGVDQKSMDQIFVLCVTYKLLKVDHEILHDTIFQFFLTY